MQRSLQSVLLILLLVSAVDAGAQWRRLNNPAIQLEPGFDGVISYCAGRIWASGENAIWMSDDDGATWQLRGTPFGTPFPKTLDIDFLDSNNGVVTSFDSGIFITQDGGRNWVHSPIPDSLFTQAKFVASPFVIAVSTSEGRTYVTTDGAQTWRQVFPPASGEIVNLLVRPSTHTIYVMKLSQNPPSPSKICWSSDYGTTWTVTASGTTYDCYGFALDSCNVGQFVTVNEGRAVPESDNLSRIHYSLDGGLTFGVTAFNSIFYYTGTVINAIGGTLYAQSCLEGLVRSTDHGRTWQKVGGPSGNPDSRLICLKDDNTVFAMDQGGNIWATNNSGGDSVKILPNHGTLDVTAASLFDADTVVDCDSSILRSLAYSYVGCLPATVSRAVLSGPAAGSYEATLGPNDSVHVRLSPSSLHGNLPATLTIYGSDGSSHTVALNGNGRGVPFVCKFTPASVADTLTICDSPVFKRIVFDPSGCTIPKIISQTIIGSPDYAIVSPARDSLRAGDTAVISFKPITSGAKNAVYEIVFDDGTKISVPLNGVGNDGGYTRTYTPTTLHDSLYLCDPTVTRTIKFHAGGCTVPKIVSQQIIGAQSGDYTLVQPAPDSISNQDSAVIRFDLGGLGSRSAQYVVVFDDSSKIIIPLDGFGNEDRFTYSFSPSQLSDSVFVCDSPITRTIVIRTGGCPEPKVVAQQLLAGGEYILLRSTADSIAGIDSVTIRFKPTSAGMFDGSFDLQFADGSKLSVPIADVGKVVPFAANASPAVEFSSDSLYPCDAPIRRTIIISASGCPAAKIVSQQVVGLAASDYRLIREASDSIDAVDSVIVSFLPTIAGLRDAAYVLHFDNGDSLVVALLGYGEAPRTLTMQTADQDVTVLGTRIHVPLQVDGLATPQTLEVVMHYDLSSDLDYLGSFTPVGTSVDIVSEAWPGRSRLRIPSATSGVVCTADFNVFADTLATPHVWFDSLSVVNTPAPCAFTSGAGDSSVVSIISGCGISTISRYLHHGMLPHITITPNPANGSVDLTSSVSGDGTWSVIDVLGGTQLQDRTSFVAGLAVAVDIRSLMAGAYVVRIVVNGSVSSHPLLVVR